MVVPDARGCQQGAYESSQDLDLLVQVFDIMNGLDLHRISRPSLGEVFGWEIRARW